MLSTEVLQEKLQRSQASRVRAWNVLQKFRDILQRANVCEVPTVTYPASFDLEGKILSRALVETLVHLRREIDELEEAIEKVRPFVGKASRDADLPAAVIRLNRATGKARTSIEIIRGML